MRRWQDAAGVGVLVLAAALVSWDVLFRGRVLYWGTASLQFVPWHQLAADAIRSGHAPLWTHALGNGAPLLANLQSAVLYPPNLLYLIMPTAQAMSVLFALHLALAGLFAYLLARAWRLRPASALVAGLAYGLAGFAVSRSQFGSMTSAYPWLSASVLMAERLFRRPSLRRAVGLALALAVFLCAGHAQMLYYALLVLGGYAVWRGWVGISSTRRARGSVVAAGWLTLAVALGVLLAAAQALPTAELLAQSQRPGGPDYERAMAYSLWPWHLLAFLAPDLFGNPARANYWGYANYWEDCGFIGVLPLLLAVMAGAAAIRRWFRRKPPHPAQADGGPATPTPTGFLLVVAVVALFMALGSHSPLYLLAYRWFPGIAWFQAPARFLFVYTFAAAMLAGFGAERIAPSRRWVFWGRLTLAGGLAAAAMLLVLQAVPPFGESTFPAALLRLAVTAAGIGAWAAACPTRGDPRRVAAWRWAVAVIALVELATFGRPLIPTAPQSAFAGEADIPAFLRETSGTARILTTDAYEYNTMFAGFTRFADFGPQGEATVRALRASLLPNLCALEGLETASNYDPLLLARHAELRARAEAATGDAQKRLLGLMNVRYVVARAAPDGWRVVQDSPGMVIAENDAVFPRVRVVSCARQVRAPDEWDRILRDGDFRPDCAWLETAPAIATDAAQAGTVLSWAASPNGLTVRARTDGPAYLVLSETYHQGWRAWDNGAPAPVLRANYAFMAVPLAQAGEHVVELRFAPASSAAGCAVSGAALLFAAGTLLWPAVRRRAKSARGGRQG
ncbi:MAG: hypothetical protein Kow00123_19660 [Anaerolineales bacterium]